MTTVIIKPSGPRKIELPRDLRPTLGDQILLKLALDAVQALDPSQLEAIAHEYKKYRPQMMLTLLSYCYGAGIYGSQEVADAIQNNRTVRYISAHAHPDRFEIRRFRRRNRPLLEQCLAALLKKAWVLDLEEDWDNYRAADIKTQIAEAARQKIEMAIIMDTAESD